MKWVFTIPAVLAATALATAWATPPTEEDLTEQAVQEITDLRAEVGPATADGPEFAEALRAEFAQAFQQNPPQAWTGDRPPAPPAPPSRSPGWNGPQDLYAPVPAHRYVPGSPQPVGPAGFHQPPPPPPPGPHHERPRDPKNLLRRSAAELDRLANELEIAELYDEADALREAAGKLRRSARARADRPSPKPGEPTAAAGPSMEHLRARVKNAMADTNRRQAELQAKLAEAEAQLAAARHGKRAAEQRQIAAEEDARRQLERHERELDNIEKAQRRHLERHERRPGHGEGDAPTLSPPLGVHGGPTEPGPASADALRPPSFSPLSP